MGHRESVLIILKAVSRFHGKGRIPAKHISLFPSDTGFADVPTLSLGKKNIF